MSFFRYLRDNVRFILLYFILAAFVSMMALLDADSRMVPDSPSATAGAGAQAKTMTFQQRAVYNATYTVGVSFVLFASCVAVDYAIRRKRAVRLNELIASPDNTPVLPPPADYKDEQYATLISALYSGYMESLAMLEEDFRENKEFMAAWAHEVKTPLTAARLLLDEEPDSEAKSALDEELGRIGSAVERVLFHARSDSFSKDYVISEESLGRLVKESVKRHSALFIRRRIRLTMDIPDGLTVQTDRKWLSFIIDQLVSNALKYTPESGEITLSALDAGASVELRCADNGRGISGEDIQRVFAKSFTGRNGREPGSMATGLGLYLARKLSGKLGHTITISSGYGNGTAVTLRFMKPDDMLNLTKT